MHFEGLDWVALDGDWIGKYGRQSYRCGWLSRVSRRWHIDIEVLKLFVIDYMYE